MDACNLRIGCGETGKTSQQIPHTLWISLNSVIGYQVRFNDGVHVIDGLLKSDMLWKINSLRPSSTTHQKCNICNRECTDTLNGTFAFK